MLHRDLWNRPSVTADEGATCFVLLDVDTGHMKAVPAAGKTVTDYLGEGGERFIEQFFRRRVRLRCDGEPMTLACGASLKGILDMTVKQILQNEPFGRSKNMSSCCAWILRSEQELSFWRTHACGRG